MDEDEECLQCEGKPVVWGDLCMACLKEKEDREREYWEGDDDEDD